MQSDLFGDGLGKFENLDALAAHMNGMTHDPLADSGSNVVIYRGNPETKLMVVGEAPGTNEDRERKPFVGRSGQLLDKILGAVDLDSDKDVFITNAVFRLPPGEGGKPLRKPTTAEIEWYRPYLMRIIELIDPRIILLTGAVSMQAVLQQKNLRITRVRGTWYEIDGRWVMPIFHPAYLLRNPSRQPGSPKAQTWADIRQVREKYDELGLGS